MKVKGLDGRTYTWNLVGNDNSTAVSGPHLKVRQFLKSLFPIDLVVEELILPGSKNLRVDFFFPRKRLLVEVQGRQHFEFVRHFHGDKFGFIESQRRDSAKASWANINDMGLASLDEKGTEDVWRSKIIDAIG